MIVILDYQLGNIASLGNALDKLEVNWKLSHQIEDIKNADKLILPGVGRADQAMNFIESKQLGPAIREFTNPILGICLGMQIMGAFSEEGNVKGLHFFDVNTQLFQVNEPVPHMGWNAVDFSNNALFKGIEPCTNFYFVHSYYVPMHLNTIASVNYGFAFSAALQNKKQYGVQFHPEKSGKDGFKLLNNFIQL